jgi:tetratricopeptide (TPR) repeat protein
MQRKLITLLLVALGFSVALAHADGVKKAPTAPKGMDTEFVYKFLVGEIAGQRGDLGLASAILLDLASTSRDASLAERATRAAIYGNRVQVALRASTLWAELDPDSSEARQTVVQLLMASGRIAELRPHLQKMLAAEDNRAGAFMSLVGMLTRSKDKAEVMKLVQELAKPYPNLPEAHFALAHAAWNNGQDKLALSELKSADQLSPGWEPGALLKGQVLSKSPADALQFYRQFLELYPVSSEVRLAYARLLVNEKQFEPARQQFAELIEASPDNADMHAVVGLLCVQLEDYASAETHFLKALELDFKDADQVRLYLGQLSENLNKDDTALDWYSKIEPGSQHYLEAQLHTATLMSKRGHLDEALKTLHALPDLTNEQRVLAIQTEASLLSQAKRHQEALDVLKNAIETLPSTPDLIYDYAMAAERLGHFDVMERELRKLILIKPDSGQAYNALGYSLADRNERLDEAQNLIEKALSLSPNDYFILDSMGWVKYRRGQLSQALEFLKRAYAVQSDPEIAAHLGEVLWQQGQRDEALRTWEESLRDHPDNEVLLNTSKKFHP